MENKIEIYKTPNGAEISVKLENDTIWLNTTTIAELFGVNRPAIVKHIGNIYKTFELDEISTCSILEQVAADGKKRKLNFYNLDMILSVGYRVNSTQATKFRQWATQRLKDYLVQGYAINEKRLAQKQQEIEYLKTGIRILNRAIEQQATEDDSRILRVFARGLTLLDNYDHQTLETKGTSIRETVFPTFDQYMELIRTMYSEFESGVFALPKDNSFHSSINQIAQSYGGVDLYSSIEEKGANLLYFITKNHSFVDGNKRIAAACFLYFMQMNNALYVSDENPIICNEALAALTLFIATSKTEEADIVKSLVVSILNPHSEL